MIMVNHSILAPLRRGALFWGLKKKSRPSRDFKMEGPTRHHSGPDNSRSALSALPSIWELRFCERQLVR